VAGSGKGAIWAQPRDQARIGALAPPGWVIDAAGVAGAEPSWSAGLPPWRRRAIVVALPAAAVVALLAVTVAWMVGVRGDRTARDAGAAARGYLTALVDGELQDARQLICPDQRMTVTDAQLRAASEELGARGIERFGTTHERRTVSHGSSGAASVFASIGDGQIVWTLPVVQDDHRWWACPLPGPVAGRLADEGRSP
jgi:hypothetical protein